MSTDLTKILKQNFPQLIERELREEIADVGKLLHFPAGEVIMDFGSYIKLIPLIVDGTIRVSREDVTEGREMLLYFLRAGDTCSMSFTCCMTNKKSAIRTEAVEDTTLIGIPIYYMDEWMTKYKSWKNFIMRSYDQRMFELVKVLDSVAFENLDTRLTHYLEVRASSMESTSIQATHQEIALDLNASREAVSRMLKKLEQLGKVQLGRNKVTLL